MLEVLYVTNVRRTITVEGQHQIVQKLFGVLLSLQ